jgi:hypothetical protein
METIVWDIDDVLNDLMKNWFELKWLPDHPSCNVRYEGLTQNPPHELLDVSLDVYQKSLDSFRASPEGRTLQPVEEIMGWFRRYGQQFRHMALTATPIRCAPYSAEWVLGHFGFWIRSFAFVPSKRAHDPDFRYDDVKSDYLEWLGKADILIDDNPSNTAHAERLGIRTFLVPRPWNQAKGSLADILNTISGSPST